MPIQRTSSNIKYPATEELPACQQWGHLVEKEGLSLKDAAKTHKVNLDVLLKLNPALGPQNKVLSPFHDLVILPKNFSKVDGADICIRDNENNLLSYENRNYIPSFVKEIVEEWGQNFLNKLDEPAKNDVSLELATFGPNSLSFHVNEEQSQITNVKRKNSSFKFIIRSSKSDLTDIDKKIREAFSSLSEDKRKFIIVSKTENNPAKNSLVITFTLPK